MSIDTVNDLPPRVQYTAAVAQTVFDYPFPIFEDADLVVDVDGVTKSLDTDYTVVGEGEDAGGTVTFLSAMAGGEVVTIYRDIAVARDTDFQQNGPFRSASINDELDKAFLIMQQLKSLVGRCLRLPITAAATDAQTQLSPISNWLGKYLTINASGVPEPAALADETMTQSTIGALLYPVIAAETSAGAVVVNAHYPPGQIERYGTNTTPGTTDMTTAVQTAFTLACDYGVTCRAAGGTYAVTTTLDCDAFTPGVSAAFVAEGRVRIICSDDTVPVVDIGGRAMRWIGVWGFEHSSLPASANTNAVGWRVNNYLAYCVFDQIFFHKNYAGIAPAQSGGYFGANVAFANTFGLLYVTQFSGLAIDWDSAPTGGFTPTFVSGCYINNFQDDGTTKNETTTYPVQVKSGDALSFGHLHIEHMIAPGVIQTGSDSGALIAQAVHIEGFEANGQNQLIDCLANSGVLIGQMYMNGCEFLNADIGGNTYGLFRVAAGSQVIVDRFYETNNTVDITSWKVARANSPDIESFVKVNGGKVTTSTGGAYTTILLTADTSQDLNSNLPSILRTWLGKENFRVIDSPNNIYEWWASAAPSLGTWTRGSVVWNGTPSIGSPVGWKCISAGTPGTWEPFGVVGEPSGTETITGTVSCELNYRRSDMNSSGGAVTATLGDGQYDGQQHKVTMSDASNSSTLSVTSHETSDPEVFTFANVGDSLLLEWDAQNAYWWTVKNIGAAT